MSNVTKRESFTPEQMDIIKNSICRDASDDELKYFLYVCQKTNLDPMAKQIYSIPRWNNKTGRFDRSIQTSIDGLRLIAERTGKYLGQTTPLFCGEDGIWKEVWISKTPPSAAKVGVYKKGMKEPTYAIALWSEYVQTGKNGVTQMWQKFPTLMISKIAESLALRKVFAQDLSGIYIEEEFDQSESIEQEKQAFINPEPNKLQIEASKKTELIEEIRSISASKCQAMSQNEKLNFMTDVLSVSKFTDLNNMKIENLEVIKRAAEIFEKKELTEDEIINLVASEALKNSK